MVKFLQNDCGDDAIITIEIDKCLITYLVFKDKKYNKIINLGKFNDLDLNNLNNVIINHFYDFQVNVTKNIIISFYYHYNWTDGYETELSIIEAIKNISKNKLLSRKLKILNVYDKITSK